MYKLPNGKWRAEVVLGWDGTKRIRKTKSGFTRKKDALAAIPELFGSPMAVDTRITFKGMYDLWSASHFTRVSKHTEQGYRASYAHCAPLHHLKFTDLKTADLQTVVDNCTYEKGSGDEKETVPAGWRVKKEIKTLLGCLYQYAIENDYCDKNYASFIKLPAKPKGSKDAFTDAEIQKLWDDYAAGNIFTGYILVMIYTGMRYGELAKILKKNIFLDEQYMIGGIKTDAGIDRVIPISDRILPIVRHFHDTCKKKILEIHEKVFYNQFYATLERLQIRKLNPHCCRHTFATLMANAGVQPAVITETAGHEDYATTLQYTHIPLSEKLKAVNSLK